MCKLVFYGKGTHNNELNLLKNPLSFQFDVIDKETNINEFQWKSGIGLLVIWSKLKLKNW